MGRTEGMLLVVDDDEINRAILSNIFRDEFTVLEAENGQEGLKLLEEHEQSIRAILLDVVMPPMNGLEVLTHLQQQGTILQKIPVFLITADPGTATMQQAYSLGVMDVISKPVIPYVVRRRVNSVVELFHARALLGAEVERQRDQLLLQTRKLAEMGMGMVEALATAIEFRSDESGEHVRRIRDITCYMLRNTPLGQGLSEEEIDLIGVGAITHDVGKISIPDAILHKQGRLTPEEYQVIKTHTVKGVELLSSIPQMKVHQAYRYAYDIALHHHERWDGKGYPDGLAGEQIPIWTQIVSLADAYDALVSKRCYKEQCSGARARKMICNGECGCFNPQLLECFFQVEPVLNRLYFSAERKTG